MLAKLLRQVEDRERRRRAAEADDLDRSHWLRSSNPLEAGLASKIHALSEIEQRFLVRAFGLEGHDPMRTQAIAERERLPLFRALDILEGAKLRLRARGGQILEAIAGEEMVALGRRLLDAEDAGASICPQAWFRSRRPLRRLAMATAIDGGFEEFHRVVADNLVLLRAGMQAPGSAREAAAEEALEPGA